MTAFEFADDSPRSDPWTEDDFGYRQFSKRLADILLEISAPNGFVVGLHGSWGTGKTTALNFVRYFIQDAISRSGTDQVQVVRFEPWMISGQHDLITSFFRVLAESLKDGSQGIQKAKRTAGKAAKVVVDPLVKAAVSVAVAASPSDAPAINVGADLAKSAVNKTIDAWLGEPTLQATHKDLARLLRKSGKRFLVFIDDIDRLEQSEVRSIMQMVKSVGRLPNVIYVLSYDRRIVWRALQELDALKEGEPSFMEKIVQHEVRLPHVTRSSLLKLLDREAAFVLSNVEGGRRWREIVQHGIGRWVKSPRDVQRFANALRFAWPPLKGEVDAGDVLALEGLRLFEPAIFEWIRTNRDLLIGSSTYRSEEDQNAVFLAMRESIDPARRTDVIELLSVLFSSRSKLIRGTDRFGFSEIWASVVERRGVGSPRGYDAYFALFPSEHAVPKALLDEAMDASDDPEVQDRAMKFVLERKDENGQPLISEYLEELQMRMVGTRALKPGDALIGALVRHAKDIQPIESKGVALLSPNNLYNFLLRDLLAARSIKQASTVLLAAVEAADSASVVSSLYVWRAREAGVLPSEGMKEGPFIDEQTLTRLGERALVLILEQAADGRLVDAPYYWDIMQAWTHLGDAEAAKEWLMNLVENDPRALTKVTKGILAWSQRDDGTNEYSYRGLSEDRAFYDETRLMNAADRFIGTENLSEDERVRMTVLADGIRAAIRRKLDLDGTQGD